MDKTLRAEMDKLHGDIIAALYIDGDRASDVAGSVRAYDEGQVVLLRLFWRFLPDRDIQFHDLRNLYMILKGQGIHNAEQYVTADRVHTLKSLWNEAGALAMSHPDFLAADRVAFMVMIDQSDSALARQIVLDRWPGSREQAQSLLEEMKRSPQPLASGSL
jgi:hypothetical protein